MRGSSRNFASGVIALGLAVQLGTPVMTNPVSYLGSVLDTTGCRVTPLLIGSGNTVTCKGWSAVTSVHGVVMVVTLGTGYMGALPQGLRWHESLPNVLDKLGSPRRVTPVYGTPTLVYMYEGSPYGSLELRFNDKTKLIGINACLTH